MYSERQLRRPAEKGKKWFDAASKLPKRDRPLGRLIHEGDNHIRTVEKIQSNMRPLTSGGGRPANDRLIARHLRGWKMKVAGWKASREAKAAREAKAPRDDGNSAPPGRAAKARQAADELGSGGAPALGAGVGVSALASTIVQSDSEKSLYNALICSAAARVASHVALPASSECYLRHSGRKNHD